MISELNIHLEKISFLSTFCKQTYVIDQFKFSQGFFFLYSFIILIISFITFGDITYPRAALTNISDPFILGPYFLKKKKTFELAVFRTKNSDIEATREISTKNKTKIFHRAEIIFLKIKQRKWVEKIFCNSS